MIETIIEHAAIVISVLALLVAAAGKIVPLTKTPKDDEVVAKLEKLVAKAQEVIEKNKPTTPPTV